MASFYCLIAVVFSIVCLCATPAFVQENSTLQAGNNAFVGCKINTNVVNKTSNSTGCKLLIDKSKIKEVLSKHENHVTNTIKIKISVVPGNKTRYFEEWELAWANEIGRTIISLVRRAKDTIFTSPFFILPLEVGTEEVDVKVTEKTDGCLPPGDEGSDQIFDFLLHQLSHSEDKHVFKLCRSHVGESTQLTTFNCCRIVGDRNLPICADYSSVVVTFALPAVITVFLISFFMVLPFVFEHIITYPTIKFYKTSESHMSLVSIVSKVFFEGCGPAKSFFRRCVFAGLSYLVFLPNFFGAWQLERLFIVWLIIFVLVNDDQMTSEKSQKECIKKECETYCKKICIEKCKEECEKNCVRPQWGTKIILCFTIPFCCLHAFFWEVCTYLERECCKNSECAKNCKECKNSKWCEFLCDLFCNLLHSLKGIFIWLLLITFLIVYLVSVITLLVKFSIVDLLGFFMLPHHYRNAKCLKKILCLVRIVTLAVSVFFTGMIFVLALSIVVGLTLNAEYFNPFIAPILTLTIYCWKNWKFSVEAKSLQLKTSIIEVCKEKARATEFRQNSPNIGSTLNNEVCEEKARDTKNEQRSPNIGSTLNIEVCEEKARATKNEQSSPNIGSTLNIEVCEEKARATKNEQSSPNIGSTLNTEVCEEKVRDTKNKQSSPNIGSTSNIEVCEEKVRDTKNEQSSPNIASTLNTEVCEEKVRDTKNEQSSPNIASTSNIEVCEEKVRAMKSKQSSPNIGKISNVKNNNEQKERLATKRQKEMDRFCDFLCSCIRDTSKDPHTWASRSSLLKSCKSCCCCCECNCKCSCDEASTTEEIPLQHKGTKKADGDMNGKELTIEFDKHGEAMISIKLYEKIRKKILHLDHILFYFFRRVIFVGLYVFGMFTVMIVARDSGVSESVQVIGAIAAALMPFVFDTIFADLHSSNKTSKDTATKQKLEHILKVKNREKNIIFVELINIKNKKNKKEQVNEQQETTKKEETTTSGDPEKSGSHHVVKMPDAVDGEAE